MPTPRANLPQLSEAQASKTTTINEAFLLLEALTVGGVIEIANTPPGTPTDGDIYIVAASPTGAWAGQAQKLAHWTNGAWAFYTPKTGWHTLSIADAALYWYNGTTWVAV